MLYFLKIKCQSNEITWFFDIYHDIDICGYIFLSCCILISYLYGFVVYLCMCPTVHCPVPVSDSVLHGLLSSSISYVVLSQFCFLDVFIPKLHSFISFPMFHRVMSYETSIMCVKFQICNGATFVLADKVNNPRDNSPMLLFQGIWHNQVHQSYNLWSYNILTILCAL